jgi:hypothetical protein
MKIPAKTVTVTLESPDGNAVLEFERLKYSLFVQRMAALEDVRRNEKDEIADLPAFNKAYRDYRAAWFGSCLKVAGLENPDGSPVTTNQVKAMDLYPDVVNLIFDALQASMAVETGAGEKNGSLGGEQPPDSAPASSTSQT